jgi:hypothetical protein
VSKLPRARPAQHHRHHQARRRVLRAAALFSVAVIRIMYYMYSKPHRVNNHSLHTSHLARPCCTCNPGGLSVLLANKGGVTRPRYRSWSAAPPRARPSPSTACVATPTSSLSAPKTKMQTQMRIPMVGSKCKRRMTAPPSARPAGPAPRAAGRAAGGLPGDARRARCCHLNGPIKFHQCFSRQHTTRGV